MKGMRSYKLALLAGVSQTVSVAGTWVQVVKAASPVKILLDEGSQVLDDVEQGQGGGFHYSRVSVESTVDQSVTLWLGEGVATDSRANLNANLAVTVAGSNGGVVGGDATVSPGSQSYVSANPDRVEIILKNPSSNAGSFRVAGASMSADTHGFELEPGETVVLNTTGAVYVRNLSGNSAQKFSYSQFTRV